MEHEYTSTACFHAAEHEGERAAALHRRCRLVCKFCLRPCRCHCHTVLPEAGAS